MKNDSLYINVSLPWGVVEKAEKGTSLLMLAEKHRERCKSIIVAAKVNNDIKELGYLLNEVAPLIHRFDTQRRNKDLSKEPGFVMLKACNDLSLAGKSRYCILIKEVVL